MAFTREIVPPSWGAISGLPTERLRRHTLYDRLPGFANRQTVRPLPLQQAREHRPFMPPALSGVPSRIAYGSGKYTDQDIAHMNKLGFDFMQLCQRNRDGSQTTQYQRSRSLRSISQQLQELGYRNMRASSLKPKHVTALIERWQGEGISDGTIKLLDR